MVCSLAIGSRVSAPTYILTCSMALVDGGTARTLGGIFKREI